MGSIIKFFVFLLGLVGLSASKKKKAEPKFNNMNDLQKGVAVNRETKSETISETKSSLTFGK